MKSILLGVLLVSILTVGCKQPPAPQPRHTPPPVVQPQPIEHVIQFSGETLGVISAWYTDKASNWTAIRDANPGLKPNRLRLGMRILIPEHLVIRRDPMPKDFVRKFYGTKKSSSSEAAKKAADSKKAEAPSTEVSSPEDDTSAGADAATIGDVASDSAGTDAAKSESAGVVVAEPTPTEVEDAAPGSVDPGSSGQEPVEKEAVDQGPVDQEREKLLDELLN